jgi:3-deoxy-D-arabino-heptulosonate 7-phosphate (DAHP) synthase
MAGFEQKGRFLAEFERQTTSCEILRLVPHRGAGCALPMLFRVHAYVDDQLLEAAAKTAKAAFAKAIEWRVVGRLTDVSISDGTRRYSIAEFASVMAQAEIANTAASAEQKASAEGQS